MSLNQTLAIALFLSIGCASQAPTTVPQAPHPAVATTSDWIVAPNAPPIVLREPTGATITLVPIVSPFDEGKVNYFLFQANSTGSAHDGLVVIVEKSTHYGVTGFQSQIGANPWTLLEYTRSKNRWTFKGYDYREPNVEFVAVDLPSDSEGLLRLRKQQEKGTRLARLEPATLAQKRAAQEQSLAENAHTKTSCGKISTSINWSTTSEADFQNFSIAGRCSRAIVHLRQFCEHYPQETAAIKNSLSLTCNLSGPASKGELSITDGTHIQFTVGTGAKLEIQDSWDVFLDTFGGRVQALRVGDLQFIARVDKRLTLYQRNNDTFHRVASHERIHFESFTIDEGVIESSVEVHGKWTLHCDDAQQPIEILTGTERQVMLAEAKYSEEPIWSREPYFLARDLQGRYYYVDRYKERLGGKRYRVFVGRRGQLKLTKLKRMVEDSEGTLFSTDSGDLRLVVKESRRQPREAVWLSNKKKTNLTPVFISKNAKLVYDELGVYYGEDLGLVCR